MCVPIQGFFSGTPSGCIHFVVTGGIARGLAQPPATICHPFGMGIQTNRQALDSTENVEEPLFFLNLRRCF